MAGKFLDTLNQLLGNPVGKKAFFGRNASAKLLQDSGLTVLEIYEKSGIDPELLDGERELLKILEKVSEDGKKRALQLIRELEEPWWLKEFDTDQNTGHRLQEFTRKRFAASLSRDTYLDKDNHPILMSIRTFYHTRNFKTDDLPSLARELSTSFAYLMNLSLDDVSFYSKDKLADRVFIEAKMLNTKNTIIPFEFIRALYEKEEQ